MPKISIDKGTDELQQKRTLGITSEPLDLCLRYGVVTEGQYEAAVRLRWLFTVCFGVPTASSVDLENKDYSANNRSDEWQKKKETEYKNIINMLSKYGYKKAILDICVYSKMPDFLVIAEGKKNLHLSVRKSSGSLQKLKEGFAVLEGYFSGYAAKSNHKYIKA